MSKIILWVVVGAIVVFGGYSLINRDKASDTKLEQNQEEQGANVPEGKKMAFSQFVKQDGGSYKCEVKQYLSDMENSGTVYISAGKIQGEYSTIAEGKSMKTSFLLRDGYSYTWSDAFPTMGFKVKISQDAANNTGASGSYSWNADQIGDYNCETWVANDSQFALPTGITFTEVGNK